MASSNNAKRGAEPSAPSSQNNYGPPPPSYGYGQAPPQMPYYQQPQSQPQPQASYQPARTQTSHGLLGSLGNLGKDVAKGLNSFASDANTVYSRSVHGDILSQMQTGMTVVLISRMSGRSLQIVQASDGRLIADAACHDSPQVFNNKWLVTKARDHYMFCNYNNYLAIDGGQLVVLPGIPNPGQAPQCAKFKLSQSEHFVMLESVATRGHYVAANERGEVKPPVASSNDKFSQFGVQFVSYGGGGH